MMKFRNIISSLRWLDVENADQQINVEDIDPAPSSLDRGAMTDWEKKFKDLNKEFTKVAEEKILLIEENSKLRSHNGTRRLLDELIKPFATRSFLFMSIYCGTVGAILILHGFKASLFSLKSEFSLPETVLNYLVGSTAVTVIGLVGMVLTGVFVGGRPK